MMRAPQMKTTDELETLPARQASAAVVIADDLTGACDTGVQFALRGLNSIVELASSDPPLEAEIRIANSRSRHQSPEAAAEEVERLTRPMAPAANAILFKKIDSTLRGNIVSESRAMMRAAALDFAVLAPALPAQGRSVARGVLHIRDCTGSLAIDVRELLSQQGLDKIALLSAGVAARPGKIAQDILQLRATGTEFIICDSETEQDLERIAQALHELPTRPLWVGSAGLAKYAAQILAIARDSSGSPHVTSPGKIGTPAARNSDGHRAPVLFCVGSDHPVTLLQVKRLEESGQASALDAKTATPSDVRKIIQQMRHALLLLYDASAADRARIRLLIAEAHRSGISAAFLSGGSTAELVCDAIGATAIQLQDEVSPGIPRGILRGGLLDRLAVATKAGGFGDEMALVNAAKILCAIAPDAA
ncbi:MAG: four-carbon acid sugar kinase family protein [Candidatus Acidiferrales bacterium]